jgi:hypothetical protein
MIKISLEFSADLNWFVYNNVHKILNLWLNLLTASGEIYVGWYLGL